MNPRAFIFHRRALTCSREPPREGNPLLELNLPNFILAPHVAWASNEAMQTLADQLIANIEAFRRRPPAKSRRVKQAIRERKSYNLDKTADYQKEVLR